MTLVVDASVAVKWFIPEDLHQAARGLLQMGQRLTAPDLVLTEVSNLAWRRHRTRTLTARQATAMPLALQSGILDLLPSADLIDRALAIALELDHPVYDCLHLACAEASGGVLVTADRRLAAAVEGGDLHRLVRPLASPAP
jgi:predicted nucleic acid-binding protein